MSIRSPWRQHGVRPRRAAVLMETLVAVAIFVGAASFAMAAARSAFAAIHRTGREIQAADLARSRLAELEAGLVTINDLRGPSSARAGSAAERRSGGVDAAAPRWRLDVRTVPTAFTGLTLVELTVREGDGASADAAQFTLRQLVRTSPDGAADSGSAADARPNDQPAAGSTTTPPGGAGSR